MKLIVMFSVLGHIPVPWSVPNIGTGYGKKGQRFRFAKRGKKTRDIEHLSLEDWQAQVQRAAMAETIGKELHMGPVKLVAHFYLPVPPGRRNGELVHPTVEFDGEKMEFVKTGPRLADLTNLVKAIEDPLEGVVYANDVQVRGHESVVLYGERPGVTIAVYAYESKDHPGSGDPVPQPTKPRRRCRKEAVAASGPSEATTPPSTPSGSDSDSSRPRKRRPPRPKSESSPSGP